MSNEHRFTYTRCDGIGRPLPGDDRVIPTVEYWPCGAVRKKSIHMQLEMLDIDEALYEILAGGEARKCE